jgi:flagellar biosynthesis protein FlhB
MAEERDDSERTEDPTPKRLEEAIKRGDVVKSAEVNTWFMIAGGTFMLMVLAPPMAASLTATFRGLIAHSWQLSADGPGTAALAKNLAITVLAALGIPLMLLCLAALAGSVIQHRFLFSVETILPRATRISPAAGIQRLFSRQALANFLKGLTMQMLGTVVAILAVVAAADYLFQYRQWFERQKMSVREMKEEFRQTEGDPTVKGKLRQLRQSRMRKRMMAAVPKASVVITNPTHFAVALKYERGMNAPVCVAKGVDLIARKIREVARQHDIPVVENPPLARALHGTVELDQEIPPEHYRAVAEIIGYIMRLRHAVGRSL